MRDDLPTRVTLMGAKKISNDDERQIDDIARAYRKKSILRWPKCCRRQINHQMWPPNHHHWNTVMCLILGYSWNVETRPPQTFLLGRVRRIGLGHGARHRENLQYYLGKHISCSNTIKELQDINIETCHFPPTSQVIWTSIPWTSGPGLQFWGDDYVAVSDRHRQPMRDPSHGAPNNSAPTSIN